jgi:hypothetical protein
VDANSHRFHFAKSFSVVDLDRCLSTAGPRQNFTGLKKLLVPQTFSVLSLLRKGNSKDRNVVIEKQQITPIILSF